MFPYVFDEKNENKICNYIDSNMHLIIHGMKKSGKKTVCFHCARLLNIPYTIISNEDIIQIISCLNESNIFQKKHILFIVCSFSKKFQSKIIHSIQNCKFVQIIWITSWYSTIVPQIQNASLLYYFKNNEMLEKNLNSFYSQMKIDRKNKNTFDFIFEINQLSKLNIRETLFNFTKRNIDLIEVYQFIVSHTDNQIIIDKCADCEHKALFANKDMYFLEHCLFFIQDNFPGDIKR